ncbi:Pentatricopeptide repeat-containing protein, chloroplastic [Erysiphe neolycopersici]|uniref:Pentatricopeptide repeat-containing protein, chloroplastic n=1 Tax=Erysiphe neolycopersici TaxID=212602 RepID=A0A420HXK3_9PEZI|nr:Pentatricopeptide repeat-containing protein, chloroplastic [Erysiphe neolycopersici]
MLARRMQEIRIDALYRCLCPSIDTITSSFSAPLLQRIVDPAPFNRKLRRSRYHSKSFWTLNSNSSKRSSRWIGVTRPLHILTCRKTNSQTPTVSEVITQVPPISLTRPLDDYAIRELHDLVLNIDLEKSETSNVIYHIVDHLITVRKERPSSLHYAALIRANVSAYWGSAESVKELLAEMDKLGIVKDSQVYHYALLALAIHPDYLLRMEILDGMKKSWINLSPDDLHYLIIGLIRDRQYEVALNKIEESLQDNIDIKPWLLDIFMYQLCESEEYDEVFSLLMYRWDHSRNEIRSEVWHFLMDSFGKGLHLEGLRFIWRHRVRLGYLIPSDGMLSAVLNTAARHADPYLATSAASILSTRSALDPYHYEALIEAFAKSKDFKSAFRALCIMAKAGFNPDASNTRPLLACLSSDRKLPSLAWDVLTDIYSDGQTITITAINVILEASASQLNIDEVMLMYKKIHTICSGPNTATFNHILQALSKTVIPSKKEAMFLASEMRSLGIKPDKLTYDRLILVCIREKDYEDAFRYLDEMIREGEGKNEGKGWWLREGTAQRCVMTTIVEGDSRGWDILAEMEKRKMKNFVKLQDWAKQNWKAKKDKMSEEKNIGDELV